jgi:hypothetical protein
MIQDAGVAEILVSDHSDGITPKWGDIGRLYKLVRKRKPFQNLNLAQGIQLL